MTYASARPTSAAMSSKYICVQAGWFSVDELSEPQEQARRRRAQARPTPESSAGSVAGQEGGAGPDGSGRRGSGSAAGITKTAR
jgi:hypothetical protein